MESKILSTGIVHSIPLLTEVVTMSNMLPSLTNCKIAIIGLGYVGLPLAVQFATSKSCCRTGIATNYSVVGFDVNQSRINELRKGYDRTNEISSQELAQASSLFLTSDAADLISADVYIVTVPTPIDSSKRPNLSPLEKATHSVGLALKERINTSPNYKPLVIYESTVYPGVTEEVCVPILEATSGFTYNKDFFCGYSPERINPGDKTHRLPSIVKVTSGSTLESGIWIDSLYGAIIAAGTHRAPSLKVAEAAKVIENTQRDLNIALINELSLIFSHLKIDTFDVLEAAGSKWNFLNFKPGLVGGHCIGVDPYYLTYKSELVGYYPQVVLAGRRINDGMARWVAEQLVLNLAKKNQSAFGSNVLVLGFTFKANCPDIRNTKVFDLVSTLKDFGLILDIVDPCLDVQEAKDVYDLDITTEILESKKYDAIILSVAHEPFVLFDVAKWQSLLKENGIVYDLHGIVPRELSPYRL